MDCQDGRIAKMHDLQEQDVQTGRTNNYSKASPSHHQFIILDPDTAAAVAVFAAAAAVSDAVTTTITTTVP
jgi:hypothetical protein